MYFVFFSIDNQSKDMVGYLQYGGLRHALSKIALPDIIVQNQPLEKPLIYFFHLPNFGSKIHLFLYQIIE